MQGKDGRVKVSKVLGTENVADLMTKYLDANSIRRYMATMGFEFVK